MSERIIRPDDAIALAYSRALRGYHMGDGVVVDGLFLGYAVAGNPESKQIERPGVLSRGERKRFTYALAEYTKVGTAAMVSTVDLAFEHVRENHGYEVYGTVAGSPVRPFGTEAFGTSKGIYAVTHPELPHPTNDQLVELCETLYVAGQNLQTDMRHLAMTTPELSYKPDQAGRIATIAGGMLWVPSAVMPGSRV